MRHLHNIYVYSVKKKMQVLKELLEPAHVHEVPYMVQVSGIEDDAEKVGVEAYVLRKITN